MNITTAEPGDQNTSIVQKISKMLLQRILSKAVRPGDRINEHQLAAEFDVSRGPIREALRSTELSHLVEVVHNKGVFVRKLDMVEVLHLYDVRSSLAYSAGKLLARRASAEQIAALYALCAAMEERRAQKDPLAYAERAIPCSSDELHGQSAADRVVQNSGPGASGFPARKYVQCFTHADVE